MIHRKKIIRIWILTSLIIFSICSIPTISINPELPLQNILLHNIISTSGDDSPLIINGNLDLASQASEGNGTVSNPYIIQNKQIDAGGNGTCILIQNTNKYFTLKNCSLRNSRGAYPNNVGIYLKNVTLGYIVNNTIYNCFYGILLYYCKNNKIENNSISYGSAGINSWSSYKNQFLRNNLHKNHSGIAFYESNKNSIINNTASENTYGFYIDYYNDDNIIVGNSGNNNNDTGLLLGWDSQNNTLKNNIFNYNKIYGILLWNGVHNNTLISNTVNDNKYGIYLYYASYNDIEWNTLINNEFGIFQQPEDGGNIIQNNLRQDKIHIDFNFLFIELGVICAVGIILLMWKAKRLKLW